MMRNILPILGLSGISVLASFGSADAQTHPYSGGNLLPICDFGKTTCAGSGMHRGVDLMGSEGDKIVSMCKGTVVYNNTNKENVWDAFLVIQHDCNGQEVFGYYGHLTSSIKGTVEEGQLLGTLRAYKTTSGNDNEHLHFGVSKTLHKSGWGYGSKSDFYHPNDAINMKPVKPSTPSPSAPKLVKAVQSGSKVGLLWALVSGGTNYRIQIAKSSTSWSKDDGFASPIVNTTSFKANNEHGAYQWDNASAGNYQFTVRVNVDGVGSSEFSSPYKFSVQ